MGNELINILAAVIAMIAAYLARRSLNRAEGYHQKIDTLSQQVNHLSIQLEAERARRRRKKKKKRQVIAEE